jgi:outer membrane usher protein
MRGVSLLALLPVLAALWAPATASATSPEEILELRVNGSESGPALLVRRDADGVLLVKAADFGSLRLATPQQAPVEIEGEPYFRIDETMGATVQYDDRTQSADLTLPAGAFMATVTERAMNSPNPATVSPGAFLNYNVSTQRIDDREESGALLELGAFGRRGVLTSSTIARDVREGAGATRLDSTWTLDLPARLSTLRVGDGISGSGAWGRSVRFGGVQFGTNFATQPTLVTAPLLAARGEAVVPSTVDVFINGQPVASESVPPGPFAIENLPAISGAGELQVIVTDALGRQQVLAQPYYSGPSLLRAGLNEYSVELGAIREDYALESFSYGELVGAATFRRGITDAFTAELHGETQVDGASALGVDTAWQVATVGVVSATAAAGSDSEDSGWLGGLGLERSGRRIHLFARTQFTSERFVQIGRTSFEERPRQRSFAGIGVDFARYGNLQFAYGQQSFWDSQTVDTLGLSYSVSLGAYGFVNLFANHARASDTRTEAFLSWTMPFGERRSVGASLAFRPDEPRDTVQATATLLQNLPAGSGTGYYLGASSTEDAEARVSFQGRAGQASLEYSRRNDIDGWRGTALGGLTLTSAGVLPARWLDQSFAVVQVADYPDLTVYVENQPIGRTDRKGRVLLDRLRPYDTNQVSLDPAELPLDAALSSPTAQLTPAYRSGAVVRFPITRASAATMRLVQDNGEPVPAGARVHAPGGDATVALDGLTFLTNAAGYNEASASWPGHRCRFSFQRPEDGDPMPDLGEVRCRATNP